MQIIAWKCEADGKIFEDKKKYQNHLRKLAKVRRERRRIEVAEAERDALWAPLYEREQSLEEWRDMVIANQDLFWAEAAKQDPYDWSGVGKVRKGVAMPVPRLLEFTEFRLKWNDMVSNSHSCPHNGMTNWGGHNTERGAPRGYPGWEGRVEWIVAWPKEWAGVYLGGDLFNGLGGRNGGRQRAHTGTGGGGGDYYDKKHKCYVQRFGYSFEMFAADWPGLARHREKMLMWKVLKE
jgi:hypothetical protein